MVADMHSGPFNKPFKTPCDVGPTQAHLLHLPQPLHCPELFPVAACPSPPSASAPPASVDGGVPARTRTVLGSGLGVGSAFGRVTVSTPLSRLAEMSSCLTLAGTGNARLKATLREACCSLGLGGGLAGQKGRGKEWGSVQRQQHA